MDGDDGAGRGASDRSVVKRMFIIVSFDTSGNVTYKTFNNEREYQNALNNQ